MPIEKPLTITGPEFSYHFTSNSLTISRIPVREPNQDTINLK